MLFVGGLADSVDEATLHAAFLPFGPITSVQIARENKSGEAKGFGFVDFADAADAAAAVENMDRAELNDRVLRVNVAKDRDAAGADGNRPVWETNADALLQDDDAVEA